METYRYIYDYAEEDYLLIIDESETDYLVASYITEDEWTPKDTEEVFTRTYLPVGTIIYSTREGKFGTIKIVDPKDYDTPYFIDFGDQLLYNAYDEVHEIDY